MKISLTLLTLLFYSTPNFAGTLETKLRIKSCSLKLYANQYKYSVFNKIKNITGNDYLLCDTSSHIESLGRMNNENSGISFICSDSSYQFPYKTKVNFNLLNETQLETKVILGEDPGLLFSVSALNNPFSKERILENEKIIDTKVFSINEPIQLKSTIHYEVNVPFKKRMINEFLRLELQCIKE